LYHRAFAKHEIRLRARFRQQKTPARTGASGCFQLGQKKSPLSRTVTFFYQLGVRLVNFLKRRKVDDILGDSSVALVGKSCIGTSREHIRSSHTKASAIPLANGVSTQELRCLYRSSELVSVPIFDSGTNSNLTPSASRNTFPGRFGSTQS